MLSIHITNRNDIINIISIKTIEKIKKQDFNVTKEQILRYIIDSCDECGLHNGIIDNKQYYKYYQNKMNRMIEEINKLCRKSKVHYTQWERYKSLVLFSIFMVMHDYVNNTYQLITKDFLEDTVKQSIDDLKINFNMNMYDKLSVLHIIQKNKNVMVLISNEILSELSEQTHNYAKIDTKHLLYNFR